MAETPEKYAVTSEYGQCLFENEHDAIIALSMLAPYCDMLIDEREVKRQLDQDGSFNAWPLAVHKCMG